MTTKWKIEQICGLISFIDFSLCEQTHRSEYLPQWEGLFRIAPNENEFNIFLKETSQLKTQVEMKNYLNNQNPFTVIQLSCRLLKQLLSTLEYPLLPMEFAVEPVSNNQPSTPHSATFGLGSLYTDLFLHCIATHVPKKLQTSYCLMGAQLFALLRHVSLKHQFTKMNEYSLCVVLLPSVAGQRTQSLAISKKEMEMLGTFQKNQRLNVQGNLNCL